jgi:three-Cys-motif partner protein
VPRPRDIPDDSDEKWEYTEHTAAKHEILHRYLGAWLAILGQGKRGSGWRHKLLVLVDGFAGRGRYVGGEIGSPKIMFHRAVAAVDAGTAERVWIRCAEPNQINFAHLADVCSDLTHESVKISPSQETFESIANKLAGWAEEQTPPSPPMFVMVDPYGVRGVNLETLRRLLKIDRLEVLLTFMVRDPCRFLMEGNYEEPLTALFGGDTWRQCADAENRPECLMLRFREVVLNGIAKHATPFLVYEDERRVPLYYLIHLTNNDLGMRQMKQAMVKKSGEMTFWPVTVRPPGQLQLEVDENKPYPSLQNRVLERYAGRSLTFEELLNDDYPHGAWVESHYRWALDDLEERDPPCVSITRNRLTKKGRPATRGIQCPERITFL